MSQSAKNPSPIRGSKGCYREVVAGTKVLRGTLGSFSNSVASYFQRTQEPLAVEGRTMRWFERGNAPPFNSSDISKGSRTPPCARAEPPPEPRFDTQWTKWTSRIVSSRPILSFRPWTSLSTSRKQSSQGQWMVSYPGGLTSKVRWCTVQASIFEEGIEAEIYRHFPSYFRVWIGRVLSASSLHTHIGTVYRLE